MMEKETSTRRSLLRALYLLPLVCISLALNAQTKVNYVYTDGKTNSAQSNKDKNVSVDMVVNEIKMDGEALEGLPLERVMDLLQIEKGANGDLTTQGHELKKVIVNGKVLYNKDEAVKEVPSTPKVSVFDLGKDMTMEFSGYTEKTVEDLIKKLPGAEIDDEGKITVNGKPVTKILVNGNPVFFNEEDHKNGVPTAVQQLDVEEMIRNLPGVEVNDDGTYTVNGKAVSKVLYNGEELK